MADVSLSPEHQRLIETVNAMGEYALIWIDESDPAKAERIAEEYGGTRNALALKLARLERLEEALRDDAVYIAACRALRHGTPTGDACPRCKSDQRELDRIGVLLAAREEETT